uniref:CSON012051 protein n=1 Tax=Culicoides sonorensis TaxID=179676 RepID=A0A336M4K6_CULSO
MYFILSFVFSSSILFILYKKFKHKTKIFVNESQLVIITGCDSGLGHFASIACYNAGFTVLSTVLNKDSEGSQFLQDLNQHDKGLHLIELNLKDDDSIENLMKYATKILENNAEMKLHAIINNAGVMCFGEFEWLTKEIIEEQLRVNVVGPMLLIKNLLPTIRRCKTRIINVTSHCSLKPLPGLSVYSASKAALRFWTEAITYELNKFGMKVINFIPGSFIMSSNITARTLELSERMKEQMSEEQLSVYQKYFDEYYGYLSYISSYKSPKSIKFNENIILKLMDAVTDEFPEYVYKDEPLRYTFYYNLFKIIPQGMMQNWIMEKFLCMPKYDDENKKK